MRTSRSTWLAIGALCTLVWAQSPWTNWNVYADSTGNGASPVGLTPVCQDTYWLIVDTTGMAAAGITAWKWVLDNHSGTVVYDGTSAPPYPFPANGIPNKRKIGVSFLSVGTGGVLLGVATPSGPVALTRSLIIKGSPSLSLSPGAGATFCPGSSVSFQLSISGADSFKVGYGPNPTDTVRNQTTFTATAPNTSPWQVAVVAYTCGQSITSLYSYYTSPGSTSYSISTNPSGVCPGQSLVITPLYSYEVGDTTGVVVRIKDPANTVLYTANALPVTWTVPPGATPGTYTAECYFTYACGNSNTVSAPFTVYGPSSLTLPSISSYPSNYCVGTPINLAAYPTEGLVSWDIGNDGSWDHVGAFSVEHTFPSGTTFPVNIKIRQQLPCASREDVISWSPTNTTGTPSAYGNASPSSVCPGQLFQVSVYPSNFSLSQAGATLQWQASWLNSGNPFNGYSLDTLLPAPTTPGTHNISYTLTNSCGSYTGTMSIQVTSGAPNTPLPPPLIIGAACAGGGNVKVTQYPTSGAPDSIRYLLADGTVAGTFAWGDTVTISVPSGGTTLTLEYRYPCGNRYGSLPLPTSTEAASIQGGFIPSSACPGQNLSGSLNGKYIQEVRVYAGATLLFQQPANMTTPPYSSVSLSFPAPSASTTLMVVAIGCGGNDTLYHPITIAGSGAVAHFQALGSACVGQPVSFTRTGTNADVYSAQWFFGDGNSLSDTNMTVSHTYATPGLYTVTLSLQSSCGYTSYQRSVRVYGGPPSLSGLTIWTSGAQITYSVTATDADSVKWFFDFPNATPSASGLSGTHTYAANGTYTVAAIAYNPCGNDTVSQTVSIVTASLPVGALAGAWSLYPNPAHSTFTLTHPTYAGPVEVRVIDLHGRLVERRTVTHLPAQLAIALPAGLYTVQVLTPNETATLRLLVE